MALYGIIGLLGRALGRVAFIQHLLVLLAILALGLSAGWHVRGAPRVPAGRYGKQARRKYVGMRLGKLYFGSVLGTGILTELSTPLVYGGLMLAAVVWSPGSLGYGVGFGLGRSVTIWIGLLSTVRRSIHDVAGAFFLARPLARWPGAVVAAFGLAALILPGMRPT
jgi:hypothetical protein